MNLETRIWAAAIAAIILAPAGATAQVTPADYERALGLRERWMYLTDGLADPATWVGTSHRFYYRKTVKGGFQFVMVDAGTLQRRPAFDHDRLAAALSLATREKYTGLRLPFESFQFSNGENAIDLNFNESAWTCRLAEYVCSRRQQGGRGGQPRSFGAVRDTEVPPDNRPRRSPDGRWEAFVGNFNIVVRSTAAGSQSKALSNDGSEGDAYDPESSGHRTRRRSPRTASDPAIAASSIASNRRRRIKCSQNS